MLTCASSRHALYASGTRVSQSRRHDAINLLDPHPARLRVVKDLTEEARNVIRLAWDGTGPFEMPELNQELA